MGFKLSESQTKLKENRQKKLQEQAQKQEQKQKQEAQEQKQTQQEVTIEQKQEVTIEQKQEVKQEVTIEQKQKVTKSLEYEILNHAAQMPEMENILYNNRFYKSVWDAYMDCRISSDTLYKNAIKSHKAIQKEITNGINMIPVVKAALKVPQQQLIQKILNLKTEKVILKESITSQYKKFQDDKIELTTENAIWKAKELRDTAYQSAMINSYDLNKYGQQLLAADNTYNQDMKKIGKNRQDQKFQLKYAKAPQNLFPPEKQGIQVNDNVNAQTNKITDALDRIQTASNAEKVKIEELAKSAKTFEAACSQMNKLNTLIGRVPNLFEFGLRSSGVEKSREYIASATGPMSIVTTAVNLVSLISGSKADSLSMGVSTLITDGLTTVANYPTPQIANWTNSATSFIGTTAESWGLKSFSTIASVASTLINSAIDAVMTGVTVAIPMMICADVKNGAIAGLGAGVKAFFLNVVNDVAKKNVHVLDNQGQYGTPVSMGVGLIAGAITSYVSCGNGLLGCAHKVLLYSSGAHMITAIGWNLVPNYGTTGNFTGNATDGTTGNATDGTTGNFTGNATDGTTGNFTGRSTITQENSYGLDNDTSVYHI